MTDGDDSIAGILRVNIHNADGIIWLAIAVTEQVQSEAVGLVGWGVLRDWTGLSSLESHLY